MDGQAAVKGAGRPEDPSARERLAAMRTLMANERTLLAYARTALALAIAGLGGLHLLDPLLWKIVSWGSIALGAAVFAIGIARFVGCRRALRAMGGQGGQDQRPASPTHSVE